ncbi:hypothetical protein HPB49_023435 [Dermacentor silvarum]|uniref:Uncharacterized protein n=1 Tax=Dermacentor silvarum TaxID=543639 RepID=A0ACB8DRS6_DERSI|nr:hypothetical protein HPB49_023435 [Dermacentor silvarum]
MDSPSRLADTETIAHENVQAPRTFLTSSPSGVPSEVPFSVSDGEPEPAEGDSGAEHFESSPHASAPSPGSSEGIRLDQAVKKGSDESPRSGERDPAANEDRVSRGFITSPGSHTDDSEAAAFVSSHVKAADSPDQMHAASATVAGDGTGAKGENPRPSSRDSGLEEDGDTQQRGADAEEKAGPDSAASEPPERERRPLSGANGPSKQRLRPATAAASAKRVQPFGILILLMYIAIVIALVVLTIVLFTKKSAQKHRACASTECQDFAKLLASSTDASVNPCHSFARFVCGGWERSNALSVREALYQKALDRMTSHISNVQVPDSGQNDVQRAAAAFRSCNSVLSGRVDHLAAVKGALVEAGITWPRTPDLVDVLHTLLFTSLKLAWDVIVRVVPRCSGNKTVLEVNPGPYGRPSAPGGSDESEASLVQTAALERITALALVPKYHLHTQYPVPLTVPRDIGISDEDWLATVVAFGYNATTEVALVTTSPSFVGAFLDIWRRIGNNDTHLLTSWSTVQVAALYANKDLILNYYRGKGEAASVRYNAFCFTTAYLLSRGALLENYVSEAVHKDARASADGVMRSVGDAFLRRLSKWSQFQEDITVVADWSATPSEVFHETHVIRARRRLPRLISNVPDDVYEVVGAINSLELSVPSSRSKTLRLLPLSFSFPVFDVRLSAAANYAGLGGQVGSALSWLLLTAYAGDARTSDVVSNLSACVEKGPSHALQLDSALNQALTAGVLVDAYEYESAAHDTRVGAYNGTRLLLMALCYFACTGRDTVNEGAICDSAMRQAKEFARAFNCVPGTPMNPEKRCNLP